MDINGDGRPDLMYVGAYYSNNVATNLGAVSLYLNGSTGTGNFELVTNAPFTLPAAENPGLLAFGDFDEDGLLDWVVAVNNLWGVQICRNTSTPGNISFAAGGRYMTGNAPVDVKVADFDGDGKLDLVVGASHLAKKVYVYINSSSIGTMSFAPGIILPVSGNISDPRHIAVADFNGNGRPDLAVVDGGSSVYTFQNAWTGGAFGQSSFNSPSSCATGSGSVSSICVLSADIDGDGRPDIVVGNYNLRNVVVFQNVSQY